MPGKKQYNLVSDDAYDSRIPLHSEEAFHHGITFHVKYIGSLDVVRPSSRVEIVAAMRRVRYEFKAKGIKKKKVIIDVSVEGVKINLKKKKKKNDRYSDEKILLMHHPVYRIFYVSHDSQDLKIFSYIARDGASNVFKCNVFKSKRKSQALRIVRTVGQAFEVCHKLSIAQNAQNEEEKQEDLDSERSQEASNETAKKSLKPLSDRVSEPNSCDTQTEEIPNETSTVLPIAASASSPTVTEAAQPQRPNKLEPIPASSASDILISHNINDCGELYTSPLNESLICTDTLTSGNITMSGSLSSYHEVHLLRQQLDQQKQQTQVAVSQVRLLRDQLQAESNARIESQARTHQLLVHNNELLDHIQTLVKQLQDFETKIAAAQKENDNKSASGISTKDTLSMSSQQPIQILCDPATSGSTAIALPPDLHEFDSSHLHENTMFDRTSSSVPSTLFDPLRMVKTPDTVSVSSLSSSAFSRTPSFKLSPNNNEANVNYLRLNSIPLNSTSPLDRNFLTTPAVLTPALQPPMQIKQKVTRNLSSDDAILLHDNEAILKQQMPASRTVPTINSSFDIGHSYGRQYSLNLQNQQTQNIISNFADVNLNESHDSPRSRNFPDSTHKFNNISAEPGDELTRSSSFRKSFHKK